MNTQVILNAVPEILTQLLAFLIVFWILKRFAFRPVLGMLDERRKKIEDEFALIESRKKGLEDLESEYRRKLERIEEAARAKIHEAAAQGSALAKEIQEKARMDAQKMVERAKAEIDQDLAKARLSMRDEIVELSSLMTEKILAEKIDGAEHERLVDKFIKELEKI